MYSIIIIFQCKIGRKKDAALILVPRNSTLIIYMDCINLRVYRFT